MPSLQDTHRLDSQAMLATRDANVQRICENLLDKAAQREPQLTRESLETLLRRGRAHPEHRERAEIIRQTLIDRGAFNARGLATPPKRGK